MKKLFFITTVLFWQIGMFAQVGVGTITPNDSAMLDVQSTNKGMLIPRVALTGTSDNTTIASPATSLMVYNTATTSDVTPGFYYWTGTVWKTFLLTTDGSETKVTAGTNVTITGIGTTASPYMVNATGGGSASHTIGESYQGGIIFWLDATGQHGLIAATADQSTGIRWYNGTNRRTGTSGDGLYTGAMNTAVIVATQMADSQSGNFAAKVCADYSVTVGGVTYGDWYLPSKYELNLLYLQKTVVGGFSSSKYWSSSEYNDSSSYAGYFNFFTASTGDDNKSYTFYVRAVRAF